MALIQCGFRSEVLKQTTDVTVILPERLCDDDRNAVCVLYLLHGLGEDGSYWIRHTAIERLADKYGFVVVMPSIGRGFGLDRGYGTNWAQFLEKELPEAMQRYFRLPPAPGKTFIGGVSMGGYAALRLALGNPERYTAIFSMSAPLDVGVMLEMDDPDITAEFQDIAQDAIAFRAGMNHLPNLMTQAIRRFGRLPGVYLMCGKEDFLYGMNTEFRDFAGKAGLKIVWRETPGEHEWDTWDRELQHALEWMQNQVSL